MNTENEISSHTPLRSSLGKRTTRYDNTAKMTPKTMIRNLMREASPEKSPSHEMSSPYSPSANNPHVQLAEVADKLTQQLRSMYSDSLQESQVDQILRPLHSDLDQVNDVNTSVRDFVNQEREKCNGNKAQAKLLNSDIHRLESEIASINDQIKQMEEEELHTGLNRSSHSSPSRRSHYHEDMKHNSTPQWKTNTLIVITTAIITLLIVLLFGRREYSNFTPPS